jgi:hypothetical protein
MNYKTISMFAILFASFLTMTSSVLHMQTAEAQGNEAGRNCGANTAAPLNQGDCLGVGGSFNNGNDAGRNCGGNSVAVTTISGDCTSKIGSDNIRINDQDDNNDGVG